MATEIMHPFQLASDGSIAVTSNPNQQAQNHILSLISTTPGERVMLPNYGVNVKGAVFAPDDDAALSFLENDVNSAMATWEPNINVVDVAVMAEDDPEDPTAIMVEWNIKQIQTGSSTGVMTATVLIGGGVVEFSS